GSPPFNSAPSPRGGGRITPGSASTSAARPAATRPFHGSAAASADQSPDASTRFTNRSSVSCSAGLSVSPSAARSHSARSATLPPDQTALSNGFSSPASTTAVANRSQSRTNPAASSGEPSG